MNEQQPRLMNEWRIEFFGRAETNGRGLYWYMNGNKRVPLLPMFYTTDAPSTLDAGQTNVDGKTP